MAHRVPLPLGHNQRLLLEVLAQALEGAGPLVEQAALEPSQPLVQAHPLPLGQHLPQPLAKAPALVLQHQLLGEEVSLKLTECMIVMSQLILVRLAYHTHVRPSCICSPVCMLFGNAVVQPDRPVHVSTLQALSEYLKPCMVAYLHLSLTTPRTLHLHKYVGDVQHVVPVVRHLQAPAVLRSSVAVSEQMQAQCCRIWRATAAAGRRHKGCALEEDRSIRLNIWQV